MASNRRNITFLGFGEAAQAFVSGIGPALEAARFTAFDIKTLDPATAAAKRAEFTHHGVREAQSAADACAEAEVIFSLVTADQAAVAAQSVAQSPLNGAFFLDCNSCAPETKRRSAQVIEAAGGRYVDVAVMTPVHPRLHKAPCLLAGPHAEDADAALQTLGMNVTVTGGSVGDASTRKMIRSIMVKGLEALTLECFLAARKAGIEDVILNSLDTSYPGFEWPKRAPYMMERAATHGIRRAAEMEEVAQTLRDLGLEPRMTTGTVARQREVGELGLTVRAQDATNLSVLADQILHALSTATKEET